MKRNLALVFCVMIVVAFILPLPYITSFLFHEGKVKVSKNVFSESSPSTTIKNSPISEEVPVVIVFRSDISPGDYERILGEILGKTVKIERVYSLIPAIFTSISSNAVLRIAKDPRITGVWIDTKCKVIDETMTLKGDSVTTEDLRSMYSIPWSWDNTPLTGEGITIAVVDTGINASHDTLDDFEGLKKGQPKVLENLSKSFVPYELDPLEDLNGHGTMVASITAGIDYENDFLGFAPGARLVSIKVADKNGISQESWILDAFEYLSTLSEVKVVVLALGIGVQGPYSPLSQAVDALIDAGKIVIVAAGNEGPAYASLSTPADAFRAITVGATDASGQNVIGNSSERSWLLSDGWGSSRGPTLDGRVGLDIVAVGENVKAATLGGYNVFSGTSVAAPQVAGVVALLLQMYPDLSPEAIKAALRNSAKKLNSWGEWDQGAGMLNVTASFQYLENYSNRMYVAPMQLPGFNNFVLFRGENVTFKLEVGSDFSLNAIVFVHGNASEILSINPSTVSGTGLHLLDAFFNVPENASEGLYTGTVEILDASGISMNVTVSVVVKSPRVVAGVEVSKNFLGLDYYFSVDKVFFGGFFQTRINSIKDNISLIDIDIEQDDLSKIDVLIISDPEFSYSGNEISKINSFVAEGGGLIVFAEIPQTEIGTLGYEIKGSVNTRSLNEIVKNYGIKIDDSEKFAHYIYAMLSPYVVAYTNHPISSGLISLHEWTGYTDMYNVYAGDVIEALGSAAIEYIKEYAEPVAFSTSTVGNSIIGCEFTPFIVASKISRVVVVADSDFLTNPLYNTYDYLFENQRLFRNLLEWTGKVNVTGETYTDILSSQQKIKLGYPIIEDLIISPNTANPVTPTIYIEFKARDNETSSYQLDTTVSIYPYYRYWMQSAIWQFPATYDSSRDVFYTSISNTWIKENPGVYIVNVTVFDGEHSTSTFGILNIYDAYPVIETISATIIHDAKLDGTYSLAGMEDSPENWNVSIGEIPQTIVMSPITSPLTGDVEEGLFLTINATHPEVTNSQDFYVECSVLRSSGIKVQDEAYIVDVQKGVDTINITLRFDPFFLEEGKYLVQVGIEYDDMWDYEVLDITLVKPLSILEAVSVTPLIENNGSIVILNNESQNDVGALLGYTTSWPTKIETFEVSIESSHPYSLNGIVDRRNILDYINVDWTMVSMARLHFSYLQVEENFDYVEIYNIPILGNYAVSETTFTPIADGIEVVSGDDDYAVVSLPFSFPFYNETYSEIYVCTNGYITLDSGTSQYLNLDTLFLTRKMIAVDARDLITDVSVDSNSDRVVIRWYGRLAGELPPSKRDLCEVVLYPNGEIIMYYWDYSEDGVAGISYGDGRYYTKFTPQDGKAYLLTYQPPTEVPATIKPIVKYTGEQVNLWTPWIPINSSKGLWVTIKSDEDVALYGYIIDRVEFMLKPEYAVLQVFTGEYNEFTLSVPIESSHPLPINTTFIKVNISEYGNYNSLMLHFKKLGIKDSTIRILDSSNNTIVSSDTLRNYDGMEEFWLPIWLNDTSGVFYIEFSNKPSVIPTYGFQIDKIRVRRIDAQLNSTPFIDEILQTFTYQNQTLTYNITIIETNAYMLTIHFSNITLSANDSITIFDEYGSNIIKISGPISQQNIEVSVLGSKATISLLTSADNTTNIYGYTIDYVKYWRWDSASFKVENVYHFGYYDNYSAKNATGTYELKVFMIDRNRIIEKASTATYQVIENIPFSIALYINGTTSIFAYRGEVITLNASLLDIPGNVTVNSVNFYAYNITYGGIHLGTGTNITSNIWILDYTIPLSFPEAIFAVYAVATVDGELYVVGGQGLLTVQNGFNIHTLMVQCLNPDGSVNTTVSIYENGVRVAAEYVILPYVSSPATYRILMNFTDQDGSFYTLYSENPVIYEIILAENGSTLVSDQLIKYSTENFSSTFTINFKDFMPKTSTVTTSKIPPFMGLLSLNISDAGADNQTVDVRAVFIPLDSKTAILNASTFEGNVTAGLSVEFSATIENADYAMIYLIPEVLEDFTEEELSINLESGHPYPADTIKIYTIDVGGNITGITEITFSRFILENGDNVTIYDENWNVVYSVTGPIHITSEWSLTFTALGNKLYIVLDSRDGDLKTLWGFKVSSVKVKVPRNPFIIYNKATVSVFNTTQTFEINETGANSIRIHLLNITLMGGSYLEIYDQNDNLEWSTTTNGTDISTSVIPGGYAKIVLNATNTDATSLFIIDYYIVEEANWDFNRVKTISLSATGITFTGSYIPSEKEIGKTYYTWLKAYNETQQSYVISYLGKFTVVAPETPLTMNVEAIIDGTIQSIVEGTILNVAKNSTLILNMQISGITDPQNYTFIIYLSLLCPDNEQRAYMNIITSPKISSFNITVEPLQTWPSGIYDAVIYVYAWSSVHPGILFFTEFKLNISNMVPTVLILVGPPQVRFKQNITILIYPRDYEDGIYVNGSISIIDPDGNVLIIKTLSELNLNQAYGAYTFELTIPSDWKTGSYMIVANMTDSEEGSSTATATFEILPPAPIWAKWWFWAAIGGIATASLAAYYIKKRKQRLIRVERRETQESIEHRN